MTTDSTPTPSETQTQPDPAAGAVPAPGSPDPAPKPAVTPPAPSTETPASPPAPSPAPATPAVPPDGPPEKYDLKAPEGHRVDERLIASLTPTFKELGLSTAKAQKLADAYSGLVAKNLADDLSRTMSDPEIGQMNWGKTLGEVNRALSAFTTPEDRDWMEKVAGVGNRLEFVRLFAKIGRAMAEDRPARGAPTSAEKPTAASKLYGGKDLVGNGK